MNSSAVFSFAIYMAINAITPGPGNLLALNTVVRFGLKKGKNLLLGIFAGYYVVQIICASLVYGLDKFLNPAMSVMKYVGAVYILLLAVHIARSKPDLTGEDKNPSFWTGFFLQFVNVKIYLFGITALTGYILPFYSSFIALLSAALLIATVGTAATLTWVFLGGFFQKVYIRRYRIINIVLALALLECVISLLML